MLVTPHSIASPSAAFAAVSFNSTNVPTINNNPEPTPYQSSKIPQFQFEVQNQYHHLAPRALAKTLNSFLLNQIGHQTVRYEQEFEALLNGEKTYESLVSSQKTAIAWADMLDRDALLRDLGSYEEIAQQNDITSEEACTAAHVAKSHRMALAEPLVERIRLAYLFVFSDSLEDAKRTIDEAADLQLAEPALEIEHIANISRGIKSLRDIIKLACDAYCVALLFEECDTNHDGRITSDDIANVLKRRRCEVPQAVLAFLQGHFDRICACDAQNQNAITVANLEKYMQSRWLYGAFKELVVG